MSGIVLLLFAYVLSQFYRSFLAVLSPVLSSELGMTASALSYASAAWFVIFALAQFPIGAALDRIGPRRTAAILLLVGGAGGIGLFAMAGSGVAIIIAMALIGIGCAPVLMAAFYIFALEFTPAKFATLAATFVGLGTLGNVLGSQPLAAAVEAFGWRNVGFMLCAITAVVAVGIFALVKDPVVEQTGEKRGSVWDVLKVKELWLIFPMIFMGYSLAAGIRGLWAGPYLIDTFSMGTSEIGQVTLYMALALVAGSFAYGPLDRIFNTRKWIILAGNSIVLIAVAWLLFSHNKEPWQVTMAFTAIGFFGAGYAVQVAHGKGFVPKHLMGRGVTLLNFFSIGGAGVLQALSGFVVGTAAQNGGAEAGYHALFLFYAVTLVIAMGIYVFSKDSKPNPS